MEDAIQKLKDKVDSGEVTEEKVRLIATILTAYDYIAELENENHSLRTQLCLLDRGYDAAAKEASRTDAIDAEMVKVGRKKTFGECVYTWEEVGHREDENGRTIYDTLSEFERKAFKKAPDFMSKDEFMSYFEGEFTALYLDARRKAVPKITGAEAPDGE